MAATRLPVIALAFLTWASVAAAASTDAPARRLLITVAQDAQGEASRRGGHLGGPQARIYDTRSLDNLRVLQTVQVLEGRSAYILVGQSRAVPQRQVTRTIVGGQVVEHVVDGVDFRSADTGFYVLPRLSGDRVTLELTGQREVFVPGRAGNTDGQRFATTVAGRLGEWIEVAAMTEERGSERETLLGRAGTLRVENRSVLLKVDELK